MEDKEFQEFINKLKQSTEDNIPKFNKGVCKKTCNCIEIAEAQNGGEVKSYPCLGGSPINDLKSGALKN